MRYAIAQVRDKGRAAIAVALHMPLCVINLLAGDSIEIDVVSKAAPVGNNAGNLGSWMRNRP